MIGYDIVSSKMFSLHYHKYFWKALITIFLFIWQLPQNSAGLTLLLVLSFLKGIKHKEYYHHKYIILGSKCPTGISLGIFIFLKYSIKPKIIMHELGHCKQSEILGPLYLIVIGIPSIIMNLISQYSKRFSSRYYERFPENWADRLGRWS